MHRVEDVFMHKMNPESLLNAELIKFIRDLVHVFEVFGNFDDHDHRKQVLKNLLGHINNIDLSVCAFCRNKGENARSVFSHD